MFPFSKKELRIKEPGDRSDSSESEESSGQVTPSDSVFSESLPHPSFPFSPHTTRSGFKYKSSVQLPVTMPGDNSTTSSCKGLTLLHDNVPVDLWDGTDPSRNVFTFVNEIRVELGRRRFDNEDERLNFVKSRIQRKTTTTTGKLLGDDFYRKCKNVDAFLKELVLDIGADTFRGSELMAHLKAHDDSCRHSGTMDYRTAACLVGNMEMALREAFVNSPWFDVNNHSAMSFDNVISVLTFGCFFQLLTPELKEKAKKIDFDPGDSLHDFNRKLSKKVGGRTFAPVAATASTQGNTKGAKPKASRQASQSSSSSSVTPTSSSGKCSYCNKGVHAIEDCYTLWGKVRNNPQFYQRQSQATSTMAPQAPSTSSNQPKQRKKWCKHHKSTGHWTSECRNPTGTPPTGTPPTGANVAASQQLGEAPRASPSDQG